MVVLSIACALLALVLGLMAPYRVRFSMLFYSNLAPRAAWGSAWPGQVLFKWDTADCDVYAWPIG